MIEAPSTDPEAVTLWPLCRRCLAITAAILLLVGVAGVVRR